MSSLRFSNVFGVGWLETILLKLAPMGGQYWPKTLPVNVGHFLLFNHLIISKEHRRISKGVHNFSHPRTDPVVIMAVIDESGDKILLGRNVSPFRSLHRFTGRRELTVPSLEKVPWR